MDDHLERRDPARNMRRFYRLSVARDLFGTVVLLREWGRIGTHGRLKTMPMASEAEALEAARRLARSKMRRGYVPVPSRPVDSCQRPPAVIDRGEARRAGGPETRARKRT